MNVKDTLVTSAAEGVNSLLHGVRYAYVSRDTESGSARVYRYTEGANDGGLMVVVGSERECLSYLRGVLDGLQTAVAEEESESSDGPTLEESMPIGWPRRVRPGTDR